MIERANFNELVTSTRAGFVFLQSEKIRLKNLYGNPNTPNALEQCIPSGKQRAQFRTMTEKGKQ